MLLDITFPSDNTVIPMSKLIQLHLPTAEYIISILISKMKIIFSIFIVLTLGQSMHRNHERIMTFINLILLDKRVPGGKS
jgi:hypothetical protein